MSFNPISNGEIATGEPVSNATQTKIKNNFDDHEARILSVETGSASVYPPIIINVNGLCFSEWVVDDLVRTTANFNLTITGIRLLMRKAGSSGTHEITLKYKRGGGAWTSILSTNPSVAYSAGDNAISSNAVLNLSNVNIQAGDIIRLDILSSQTNAYGFLVRIDYNKT